MSVPWTQRGCSSEAESAEWPVWSYLSSSTTALWSEYCYNSDFTDSETQDRPPKSVLSFMLQCLSVGSDGFWQRGNEGEVSRPLAPPEPLVEEVPCVMCFVLLPASNTPFSSPSQVDSALAQACPRKKEDHLLEAGRTKPHLSSLHFSRALPPSLTHGIFKEISEVRSFHHSSPRKKEE